MAQPQPTQADLLYLQQNPDAAQDFRNHFGFLPAGPNDINYLNQNPDAANDFLNHFGYLPQDFQKKNTSALGAAGRGLVRGAVPGTAGAIAGAGGWALGAALAPETGGLSLGIPLVASLAAGTAGSYLAGKGQQAVLEDNPKLAAAIGQSPSQQQSDIGQHPYYSMAGEIAPQAAFFGPGGGAKMAAMGAALGGASEVGQELANDGTVDPRKVVLAAGAGSLMNKPTALGRMLPGMHGEPPVASQGQSQAPTQPPAPDPRDVEIQQTQNLLDQLNPSTDSYKAVKKTLTALQKLREAPDKIQELQNTFKLAQQQGAPQETLLELQNQIDKQQKAFETATKRMQDIRQKAAENAIPPLPEPPAMLQGSQFGVEGGEEDATGALREALNAQLDLHSDTLNQALDRLNEAQKMSEKYTKMDKEVPSFIKDRIEALNGQIKILEAKGKTLELPDSAQATLDQADKERTEPPPQQVAPSAPGELPELANEDEARSIDNQKNIEAMESNQPRATEALEGPHANLEQIDQQLAEAQKTPLQRGLEQAQTGGRVFQPTQSAYMVKDLGNNRVEVNTSVGKKVMDFNHRVPLLGSSGTNGMLYGDKTWNPTANLRGQQVNRIPFLAEHEAVETHYESLGMNYSQAHELATRAEHALFKKLHPDIPVSEYEASYKSELGKVANEAIKNPSEVAPNLIERPEQHPHNQQQRAELAEVQAKESDSDKANYVKKMTEGAQKGREVNQMWAQKKQLDKQEAASVDAGKKSNSPFAEGLPNKDTGRPDFTPDSEEANALQSGLQNADIHQAADYVMKHDPNPVRQTIAQRVKNVLKFITDNGGKFTFQLVDKNSPILQEGERGKVATERSDGVNPPTTHVAIADNSNGDRSGLSFRTVLHELLHAATHGAIELGKGNLPNTPMGKAVGDLYKLHKFLVNSLQKKVIMGGKLSDFERGILSKNLNTLDNPHELLAWGLTDESTQRLLNSIKYEGRQSIVTAFVDKLRNLLGLDKTYGSALDELLRVSDRILTPADEHMSALGEAQGYALPDKSIWDKELKPMFTGISETFKQMGDITKRIFNPQALSDAARLSGQIIREHMVGDLAHRQMQARQALGQLKEAFYKMRREDRLDFIDRMENGKAQATPELQNISNTIRSMLDAKYNEVNKIAPGAVKSFIENYFPHIWKDPEAARVYYQDVLKNPLEGSRRFLKDRIFKTIKDGLEISAKWAAEGKGKQLELVTDNPIDLVLMKMHEMDKFITGQNTINELFKHDIPKFLAKGQSVPKGATLLDNAIARIFIPDRVQVPDRRGNLSVRVANKSAVYLPNEVAQVFHNYLGPGMRQYKLFKGYLRFANVLNAAQLGLSAYHLGFTSYESVVSRAALGFYQIGKKDFAQGIKTLFTSPLALITNYQKGSSLLDAYKNGTNDPQLQNMVMGLVKAGGRVELDKLYQVGAADTLKDIINNGEYSRLLNPVRLAEGAIDYVSQFISHVVVPRQKLGVFYDMAKYEMERLGEKGASDEEIRGALQKAWDSVDNRMGQLVYDNLFWNNKVKDILLGSVRSLGWNLGTGRELLGGAIQDVPKFLMGMKSGQAEFTHKMAYMMALPLITALTGAVIGKLNGNPAQSIEDLWFPRTGHKDINGRDQRISQPSYMKDMFQYAHDPGQTVKDKLNPLLSMFADTYQNKDFYGTEVYHTDDPLYRKGLEALTYMAKQFVPFGIRNWIQEDKTGTDEVTKALGFIGLTKAPYWLEQTDAERLAGEIMKQQGVRTQASFDRSELRKEIIAKLRDNDKSQAVQQMNEAFEDHKLSVHDMRQIYQESMTDPLTWAVKHLDGEAIMRVYRVASPDERIKIYPYVMQKIMRSQVMTPEEKQQDMQELRQR